MIRGIEVGCEHLRRESGDFLKGTLNRYGVPSPGVQAEAETV